MAASKLTPKQFLDALIYDDAFRTSFQANPYNVLTTQLDVPNAASIPAGAFPANFRLPPPHRIRRMVDALEANGFFPVSGGHDLYAIMCVVQPAFPLVAEGDAAD